MGDFWFSEGLGGGNISYLGSALKQMSWVWGGGGCLYVMDAGIGCAREGFPGSPIPLLSPQNLAPTIFRSCGASSQTPRSQRWMSWRSDGETCGQPFSSTLLHPSALRSCSHLGISPGRGTCGLMPRGELVGVNRGFKFKMKGNTNQMDL